MLRVFCLRVAQYKLALQQPQKINLNLHQYIPAYYNNYNNALFPYK